MDWVPIWWNAADYPAIAIILLVRAYHFVSMFPWFWRLYFRLRYPGYFRSGKSTGHRASRKTGRSRQDTRYSDDGYAYDEARFRDDEQSDRPTSAAVQRVQQGLVFEFQYNIFNNEYVMGNFR